MSSENFDLLLGAWLGHFEDGFHFVLDYLYPFLAYDKTEQLSRLDPESALCGIQPQSEFTQPLEQLSQIEKVFLLGL